MQGLLIFLLIGWFVVRALNSKSGETKKSARRSPRQMRDVSTLSGQFRAAAQKREAAQEPRDTAAVSQARPARPKDEPCRECETDFGYRPAAPNRISDPRPAVETAARADAPCDACETNFGYHAEPSAPLPPEDDAPAAAASGLNLAFNRNAIVQGVVYSEILGNRPRARSNKWNPYAR